MGPLTNQLHWREQHRCVRVKQVQAGFDLHLQPLPPHLLGLVLFQLIHS